jgi:subtilisin family serine protease
LGGRAQAACGSGSRTSFGGTTCADRVRHPSVSARSIAADQRSEAALEVVGLTRLMNATTGSPSVTVALLDGPVAIDHPGLSRKVITEGSRRFRAGCSLEASEACRHGTFVAGMLVARRGEFAPAICPGCRLLVRPIFPEHLGRSRRQATATAATLASAIMEVVDDGARVINLSAAMFNVSSTGDSLVEHALDYAARHGVVIVAAAGNHETLGSSSLTRHPWVISVVACYLSGRPIAMSHLSTSIGRRGLRAPGYAITSLSSDGKPLTLTGTSAAVPFVTGTVALLMSLYPAATSQSLIHAVTRPRHGGRSTIVPPLIDASAAYNVLASAF